MDTARDAFEAVRRVLEEAGNPEPEARARVIVSHALEIGLGDVYLAHPVNKAQQARVNEMARRCAAGEPVEYATGKAYFRYLTLDVTPDVLIPRQETELVAEEAVTLIQSNGFMSALDIGTGSGCIAISLATETTACVDACDISEAALALASHNARNSGAQVRFFLSDMMDGVTGTYDIIVSNPPYISEDEYQTLDSGVKDYEPKLALTADDGLAFYRILAKGAGGRLNSGGALVLEIGAGQGGDVAALLVAAGFGNVEVKQDYSGRDRIVAARKK